MIHKKQFVMKNKNLTVCLTVCLLSITVSLSQNKNGECNKDVDAVEYVSLLPHDFCMPKGYIVMDIYQTADWRGDTVDVNNDGILDIVIKYYKEKWECADTVFFAVYLGKTDTTFQYCKTFSNLCTPLVEDFFNTSWLVKNCTDEYIDRYGWENVMWIRFNQGCIIVPFSTGFDYNEGFDFYFEYDNDRENWYLTKQQKWIMADYTQTFEEEGGGVVMGPARYEKEYTEAIEIVSNGICIDDFKIDNYLR